MTIEGKKFSALTEQQKADTRDAILGYKEYMAALYTSYTRMDEGVLVVGNKYVIYAVESGDDFSNVGKTYDRQVFTATATTPTNWSNGTRVLDVTGFIVNATVFKNTIGDVSFSFDESHVSGYVINIDVPPTHTLVTKVTSSSPTVMFGTSDDGLLIKFTKPDENNSLSAKLIVEIRLYPI